MPARIKCIARKVAHAIVVAGEWNAVAYGWLPDSDVDRSKVVCEVEK